MDAASNNVTGFLEALQDERERLVSALYNELILSGASSATPFLVLSGRPFKIHDRDAVRKFSGSIALGIHARPKHGEAVDFAVAVLWDESDWLITTEIYADCESGQRLLRSFPERRATARDECMAQLREAISDLTGCANVMSEVE
jgi:hypothetical protein